MMSLSGLSDLGSLLHRREQQLAQLAKEESDLEQRQQQHGPKKHKRTEQKKPVDPLTAATASQHAMLTARSSVLNIELDLLLDRLRGLEWRSLALVGEREGVKARVGEVKAAGEAKRDEREHEGEREEQGRERLLSIRGSLAQAEATGTQAEARRAKVQSGLVRLARQAKYKLEDRTALMKLIQQSGRSRGAAASLTQTGLEPLDKKERSNQSAIMNSLRTVSQKRREIRIRMESALQEKEELYRELLEEGGEEEGTGGQVQKWIRSSLVQKIVSESVRRGEILKVVGKWYSEN